MLVERMTKYVCPNKCGSFRMLNPGVSLALCPRPGCDYAMMVPASSKQLRNNSKSKQEEQPFVCCKCGKGREDGIHVLTIINREKDGICYECSKNYAPTPTWKSPSKSSNE